LGLAGTWKKRPNGYEANFSSFGYFGVFGATGDLAY
jgi:hypothetical protein